MRISDWSSDVCSSDLVMVENYRAGAFPALGLGYEAMKAINPRLIYCSMTAFGQDGPRSSQTAYDQVVQIGRASCRERVCQYVSISVFAVSLKNKQRTKNTLTSYHKHRHYLRH